MSSTQEKNSKKRDSLVGTCLAGRYDIVERIGAGGMGAVYRATQVGVGRSVALKVIRPEHARNERVIKRFFREVRATAKIEHVNTVRLYDFGEADTGQIFLAMEHLEGRTIKNLVSSGERLSPERIAMIGAQMARGLGAAHAEGIVHRDLKPGNVMVCQQGGNEVVKVLDFGIAAFTQPSDRLESEKLTVSGMVMGTPEFMAPEQVTPGPIDHRCDLYALGCVLYLLTTGRVPHKGTTAVAVMYAHVRDEPKLPSERRHDVPDWLDDVIMKLLAKAPDARFQDAAEVVAALEQAVGLTLEQTGVPLPPRVAHEEPKSAGGMLDGQAAPLLAVMLALGLALGAAVGAVVAVLMLGR